MKALVSSALLCPILVGLPLAAQPDGDEALFWRAIRKSPRPHLLVFEDGAKQAAPMSASVKRLLQEEEIADLGLVSKTLKKDAGLAAAVRRRLSLAPSVRWAVVDPMERCLASGQALPTADGLAKTLAAKGVQSPIRVLREFLKENPAHLEARMDLLRLQLKGAERRTREALGLEPSDRAALRDMVFSDAGDGSDGSDESDGSDGSNEPNASSGQDTRNTAQMSLLASDVAEVVFGRPAPKPVPGDKTLGAEQDIKIWGGYADSFDRLFAGDDWVAGGLGWGFGGDDDKGDNAIVNVVVVNGDDAPMESYSPLVKGLYRRKLKQVETALEMAPSSNRIWSVWTRMADAVGGQSIQDVVDRLAQPPGGGFASWPKDVRRRLIDEAHAKNRWDHLVGYLWGDYEKRGAGSRINFVMDADEPNSRQNEMMRRMADAMKAGEWDTLYEPLLEALLRMGDTGRADAVMNTLHERQEQGQWSEALIRKAILLANRCGRQDVAKQWSTLYLAEKSVIGQGGAGK